MADKPKGNPPEFATVAQVRQVLETMQTLENIRARDRALIDALANGRRPYTDAEASKYQIQINVNWGGLNKKTQDANRQINNATLHTGKFFTATAQKGKIEKRDEWSRKFTDNIHKPLKRGVSGAQHFFLLRNRNASLTLHGLGPVMWMNDFTWLARAIPLEDLLIPTNTTIDKTNLSHFGVNLYLTAGEFFDMTHGDNVDKGWNKKLVNKIMAALKVEVPGNSENWTWVEQPEKLEELFKQNRCGIDTDVVPKVRLRLFLFQDPKSKKWFRRVVLREDMPDVQANDAFIYKSSEPFADHINHILHIQFGDNSLVSPLHYHSVRGIGTMLYGPEECTNRMMCQYVQHVFEQLLTWFRIRDPVDQARVKAIVLRQYGILEDGLEIVPQADRHTIDPTLVESVLAKFRQVMSENSANFVQDINDGTNKEMTAFETKARLSSVNVMVSGTLQTMYLQEAFYYEEVVRRFLRKNSDDEAVKEFREACKRDKIPEELMVPEAWLIEPERVLGSGDQIMAQERADRMLSQVQRLDPEKQRTVIRQWFTVTSDNPTMGAFLVPDMPPEATDGTFAAEARFGTLMTGTPVHMLEGIDQAGYTQAMMGMLIAAVQRIMQTDGVGTPQDVIGFQTVAADVEAHLQLLAQNPENKALVTELTKAISKVMNDVRAMAQRQEEAAAAAQIDPEAQAKMQTDAMVAQQKMQLDSASAEQKMALSAADAQQKMALRQQEFEQQMAQDLEKHRLETARMMAEATQEMMANAAKTKSEIDNADAKNEAQIAAQKKAAAAKPKPQPVSK